MLKASNGKRNCVSVSVYILVKQSFFELVKPFHRFDITVIVFRLVENKISVAETHENVRAHMFVS